MKAIGRTVCLMTLSGLVGGCSLLSERETIGGLRKTQSEQTDFSFENLDHHKIRQEYQELIDLVDDQNLKEQIQRRIADVYMLEGNNNQSKAATSPNQSHYLEAIEAYSDILHQHPDSADNDEVLYQLAKAYDMEGRQEDALLMLRQLTSQYPNYPHVAESFFRMGDLYFNDKNYTQAYDAYLEVTRRRVEKLNVNAHYMLGWSLYKQGAYHESLESFAYALSQLLTKKQALDHLENGQVPLMKDTLHSMTLALANTGGAEMIKGIGKLDKSDYVWMVYDDLGEFYLEKERFEDSANTFRTFVTGHTDSPKAPQMHSKLINAYIKGGFPSQALLEKERFIEYYGLHSKANGSKRVRDEVKEDLKTFMYEIAKYYHHEGQEIRKSLTGIDREKENNIYMELDRKMVESFGKAARFYNEYIDTFPRDQSVEELVYLKAEALFSARQFSKAIKDYEKVAYDFGDDKQTRQRADAGYAAILSYQSHIDSLNGDTEEAKEYQQRAVDSMLRFSATYHKDERSPLVLTNAAEYLFSLDNYEQALEVSSGLIEGNNALDQSLIKTARGIMAHSWFKLGDYAQAESQYMRQRDLVAKDSDEYKGITDRLAAAIYKKAEAMIAIGKREGAIEEFLNLKVHAPLSDIRVTAQFDAATLLLESEQWNRAIIEFKEMIGLFPEHDLAPDFPRKIAFAYEKRKDWVHAAEQYIGIYNIDPEPAIRQDALFLAAGFFEKSQQYEKAIKYFKQYAHQYEQPFDNRMEARYQLAVIYEKLNDRLRHLYWLRRIIDGDKKGGDQRTERSRWLGAWANIKYGDYFNWEFERKRLRLPLEKTLPAKNKALKDASTRYQMAVDYGILEFLTMASFRIAGLYEHFAQQLLDSPMPKGLSKADRGVYTALIEEQALPFLTLAVDVHQSNIERGWDGQFNEWIDKSFAEMARLSPARFNKTEMVASYGDEIF